MAKKIKFKVKLEGQDGSEVTAVVAPFNVQEVFGTRARVPVRGTVNDFAYRSSLTPMGGRHLMVVNREMRAGAGVKAGDTVTVVMERDDAERTVEIPAVLKAEMRKAKLPRRTGRSIRTRIKRKWPARSQK